MTTEQKLIIIDVSNLFNEVQEVIDSSPHNGALETASLLDELEGKRKKLYLRAFRGKMFSAEVGGRTVQNWLDQIYYKIYDAIKALRSAELA